MSFCTEIADKSILTVILTTSEGEIDYESGFLSSILPPLPALHIQVQENESNNRDSTPQTWNAISFDEEYEDTLATETINMRDMDAEDIVSSILRISGRPRESLNYLANIVEQAEDDRSEDGIADAEVNLQHRIQLQDTDLATIQSSLGDYGNPEAATMQSNNQVLLLGIRCGQIQKSYLLDLCLSLDTTLCNLFEGLKDRRTSLAGALAYIESLNSQQVFFGYGRQPLLLEDKDWESYSNLVELGSWAELKEGCLKIKDIMTVPQNLASAFCQDNGKSSQSILYVLYIFSLTGSEVSLLGKRKA